MSAVMSPFVTTALFRDAADVKRYHTKRTLREQTVGAHSFNMLMLVQHVMPDCRKEVLMAVMHHDLPELFTGDMPAPIKRANPQMSFLLDELEGDLVPLYADFGLTPMETIVVKWADRMELVLWCMEEYKLGNQFAVDTIRRGMGWILAGHLPECCEALTEEVLRALADHDITPAMGAELEMAK